MSYEEHILKHPDQKIIVTHPEDPACPGHDINPILISKSRELGFCICIHPLMQMIDFSGLDCGWCGEHVNKNAVSPEMKELRSQAVRVVLGDGKGGCTD